MMNRLYLIRFLKLFLKSDIKADWKIRTEHTSPDRKWNDSAIFMKLLLALAYHFSLNYS